MALSNSHWLDGQIIDIIQSEKEKEKNTYNVILTKRMKNKKKNPATKYVQAKIPVVFWGNMGEFCKNTLAIGMSITVNCYFWGTENTGFWNVKLVAMQCFEGMGMKPKNEFLEKQKQQQKQAIIKNTEPNHNLADMLTENNELPNNNLFDNVQPQQNKEEENFRPF